MPLSDAAIEMMNFAQREAQQSEADARLLRINRAIEYMKGDTEAETISYFPDRFITQIAYANNNITKRIIKRISQVHKVKPTSVFPQDTPSDLIQLYKKATRLDGVKFARAERMLNLLQGVFLKSTFRNNRLELDIIRDFVPIFGDDPMQPIAVTYPIQASSDILNTDAEVWAFWSAEEQFKYVKGGDIINDDDPLKGRNPYGMIPGVFCFGEGAPPEDSYMDFMPVMDIIETNLGINLAMTSMNGNIRFQNFDYPYLTNVKNVGEITISQDRFTELPPGVEMGMVGVQSHVTPTKEGVEFMYLSVAQNYGLDSKFVQGVAPESGLALKIRNQELMENRSGDLENWRMIHADMYDIRAAQIKYHFKKTMPDEVDTDFHEADEILTDKERRDKIDWEADKGWTSYAQELIDSNPDAFPGNEEENITPLDQAVEWINKNQDLNKQMKAAGTVPTALDRALDAEPTGEIT